MFPNGFPGIFSKNPDSSSQNNNYRRQSGKLPDDKLHRQRGPNVGAQNGAKRRIKTDQPGADHPNRQHGRGGTALEKHRGDHSGQQTVGRSFHGKTDIAAYPRGEQSLYGIAQFHHSEEE